MSDIDIVPELLEKDIIKLKGDNNKVIDSINSIYNIINSLDNTIWLSPEKDKITNELLPYINRKKEYYKDSFDNCITFFEKALKEYVETNSDIEKESSDLS